MVSRYRKCWERWPETYNVVCIVSAVWRDMNQQLRCMYDFVIRDEIFHLAESTQSPEQSKRE